MSSGSWRFRTDLFQSSGKVLTVKLAHGPFPLFVFPSKQEQTRAIIVFASGDGGWSTFEEAIGQACQNHGYEMVGIDSEAYAKSDYNLASLQEDYGNIADGRLANHSRLMPPPLMVGGYSDGSGAGGGRGRRASSATSGPDRAGGDRYAGPRALRPAHGGPDERALPRAPELLACRNSPETMSHLRVVQWHAQEDSTIDSLSWLDSLTAPHKEFTFPGAGHGYRDNRDDFIHRFRR